MPKPTLTELERARAVLRRHGGYSRARALTKQRRQEIARIGGLAKALKHKEKEPDENNP